MDTGVQRPRFGYGISTLKLPALEMVIRQTTQARCRMPDALHTALGWTVALGLVLSVVGFASANEPTPTQRADRRCMKCHAEEDAAPVVPGAPEPPSEPSNVFVDRDVLAASAHFEVSCVSCHPTGDPLPHPDALEPATCGASCHDQATDAYVISAHADAIARGAERAPTCATCHGGHDMPRSGQRDARLLPLSGVALCADCHQEHHGDTSSGHDAHGFFTSYLDSVHAPAASPDGMTAAASCSDCHGSHGVLPASDARSKVHRKQIPQTCGQCHIDVAEAFSKSIHGQRLSEDHADAPVCTDCHTAHNITQAATPSFLLDIVGECGACHDRSGVGPDGRSSFYETYRRSYHGQVTTLGSTRAARCSDCHGAHDILPVGDPASQLHATRRVEVCRQCHSGAKPAFAKFDPHADFRDGERYPLLHAVWIYFLILMSVTFAFFGVHSILWFVRSLVERIRHGPMPRAEAHSHAIRRFGRIDRILHALLIVTFFGLTLTGMPLLFADQRWARVLASLLGGVEAAGIIHRIFAITLMGSLVLHVLVVVIRRRSAGQPWRRWCFGPRGIVPCWKDVQDCLGMFRWFFGRGARPRFDHWTYWEKFDYWAQILGTLVLVASGLLLWIPEFFSAFLPGWIYNVASIVHGYEAMLAVGFIFTIHFFNAHLRVEKFPADDVIFTGRVSEHELAHDRGTEHERLTRTGEIETIRVAPAPPWQRLLAIVVGVIAMAIGIAMVALIVLAGLALI